jgi:hypothetical protein
MKMTRVLSFAGVMLAAAALIVIVGCGRRDFTYMPPNVHDIDGIWFKEAREGRPAIRLTMSNHGTYEIDMNGDFSRDIWGTYTVNNRNIVVFTNDPSLDVAPGVPGQYRYEISGDTIRFHLVRDRSAQRRAELYAPWTRATRV